MKRNQTRPYTRTVRDKCEVCCKLKKKQNGSLRLFLKLFTNQVLLLLLPSLAKVNPAGCYKERLFHLFHGNVVVLRWKTVAYADPIALIAFSAFHDRVYNDRPCSQSNLSTSTHTLRQWRKKDVLLGTTTTAGSANANSNQTPSPGSSQSAVAQQTTSPGPFNSQQQPQGGTAIADVQISAQMLSQHIMGEQQPSGGQIARVAPHNHYPRGTGGGTAQPQSVAGDLSQQQLYVPGVGAPSQAFSSQSGAAAAVSAAAAAHAAVAAAARVHQQHQYGHQYGHHPAAADYSYTPYKDPTSAIQHLQIQQHQPQQPTPVKYSEIVEPPPQSHHSTLKPHTNSGNTKDHLLAASTKEYHQQQLQAQVQDMCNSMQSQQMVPNQQVQQQYNPMKHHQYHLPQPHHLSTYYKHSPVPQYHHPQRYPSEANNYLADLNKIAPQMAQSIMNDPHLRDPNQMYPSQATFEPQRGSNYPPNFQQQQQRLYGRSPGSTSNLYHQKPTGLYPSSHLPRAYQVKPQSSTDPYRNMHLYQPPTAKYPPPLPPVPQQDYTKQLHLMDFNRRSYPDNIHQLNYALPSKISPTSYNQCAQQQYEYSHHYQNRHHSVTAAAMAVPPDYLQMSMKSVGYLHHEQQQLHMPDLVRDNTPKSSNSLKQYLESWNDEDLGGANDEASGGTLDLVEKPLIKIARPGEPNENIYVLDSTDIPTETVSQYLQHVPQIDKLPDNIKFYPEINKISDKYNQPYSTNSMEGILNLTSSSIKPSTTPDYSPPACLRAEEPLNIRPDLHEQQIASPKSIVFLSLPVIEEEIEAPIRSNSSTLMVEGQILASTGSINESFVVVPSPKNNCAVSPEIRHAKSSPELSFEAISGSVIVPNIAATQKLEVAPKIEDAEELNFNSEVSVNDSPLCYSAKNSQVVPKDDNLSSSVNSVDGETLDLSVSDISAVVEKSVDDNVKVVPDIQEDSVIHLASQKDTEVNDSDSAINLSHHGNVEEKPQEDKQEQIVASTKKFEREMLEENIEIETKEAEQTNVTRHENDEFLESTSEVSIKMEPFKEDEKTEILLEQQEDSPQGDDIKVSNDNFTVRGDHLKEEASPESDDMLKDNSDRIEDENECDEDIQMQDSTDDAEDIKSVEIKPLEKSHSEEEIDRNSRVEKLDVSSIESEDKLTVSTNKDDSINNKVQQESTLDKEESTTMIEEDEESISKVNSPIKPLQQENQFEETEFIDLSIRNKMKTKISSSEEKLINNSEETTNENLINEDLLEIVDKDVPESKEIDEDLDKAEIVENAEAEVGEIAIAKETSKKNVEDLEDEKQHEVVPIVLTDDVEKTENNEELVETQLELPETTNVNKSENDEEASLKPTDKNSSAIVEDLEHIASNSNIFTESSETSNISSEPTKSIENIEEPNVLEVPCIKKPTEEIEEAIHPVPPEENVLGNEEPIHHQEDNELDEGLNILRILQNNVILQIADELIQINVINTNDRKIISVIALSDCTVVTENNNNQEQVNVEEMQVVGIEENLPQEESVQEIVQVLEDIAENAANSDRKIVKLVEDESDETPVIKIDTNSEENLQEKFDDENLTPNKANENVHLNEDLDESICGPAKNDPIIQDDEPKSIELISAQVQEISNEINAPVDEGTRETPQDSVLNNLETMLEADMVPVIDFAEEENIQNEVIIGPEESQESISEEILLMDCNRNKKPEQEVTEIVDDQEIEKEAEMVHEKCSDKKILDNEKPILDISEDSAAKETKKECAEDKINDSENVDVIKENAHLENDNLSEILLQDNEHNAHSNDGSSTVNILETPALNMEDEEFKIADTNEKKSTEEVDEIKLNIVEEEIKKETVDYVEDMKDLPKGCINNLEDSNSEKSAEDQEIPEVKLEIEKSIANEMVLEDIVGEKEIDLEEGSKNKVDELENKQSDLTSTKECKKFSSKAALKLVEDNLDELKKKSVADELKQSEESGNMENDKEKEKILVEESGTFKSSAKKSLNILINPIKLVDQDISKIPEDSLSKNEQNPDAIVAKKIEEDHQDCPPKISIESQSKSMKTPDRTKIPGVDKLKTKFVIPKKSTSSTNSSSPTQNKTIAKKAKLVSFSAIVDEIKDRAEAARDKKMPSSNLTAILKKTATVVKKPPKHRETRSLSESQPKKLDATQGANNRRHSIASEIKEIAKPKIIQSKTVLKPISPIENVGEPTKVDVQKKNLDKKNTITPKESIPKKSSSQKPLESIIARISKEAKNAVTTKSTSPISKPTLVQKKVNKNPLLEIPKSSQETSNIILPPPPNKISATNNNLDIKVTSVETPNTISSKDPKQIESPKSEPELIFKKENNSPKKYTKVKVFKTRMNSFDTDLKSISQKSSEIKVKTKAELKEAIHLDIRDEPIMHIESIISEKINQESKEKFLNASPPTVQAETSNSIKPLSLIANESKPKDVEDDISFRERKNSSTPILLSDKEDDNTRKRLSLKEYNSRKRKISCCADSPASIDYSSMNSVDSPLQNMNPEPPEDDLLPPPIKIPSIDSPETTISFVSRIETSPKAEDMNLAAPSTPNVSTRIITTPMSLRSTPSGTTDDNIFVETIELQLAKNNRSIEDDKELVAKKLEDLLVAIPIGQKSDKLMKRFLNRELLSTEEMQRVKEIIKHKKAKEEFLKKQPSNEETNSITLGLGIKPLESYKKLNFDIASDIFIPNQMNDCKPFGDAPKVPKLSNTIDSVSTRSLGSYKKLNFDIASDISIPYGTANANAPRNNDKIPKNTPTKVLTVPEEKNKSQFIDSEPVFKRLQAELLNTSKSITSVLKKPSTVIGINKTASDKLSKPTRINRPIDNATKTSVNRSIKPSFLSSTTSDGKDIIQDNGDSVYEISSSSENTANNQRGHSSPTDDLKIHLRKVQPSPTELTATRKRKKKRFRNLYSADTESSDETSASNNNSPAVKSAASTEEEDKHSSAYSVICSGTVTGLPRIIIKRTNSDSSNMSSSKANSLAVVQEEVGDLGMQPVVRLMRNPRLDNLAKRKRKG